MNDDKIIPLPTSSVIEREASQWFVVLMRENVSENDKRAFQKWHDTSQKHRDAFELMSKFWGGTEVLAELQHYADADDIPELIREDRKERRKDFTKRFLVGGIAASLLAVAGFGTSNYVLNIDRGFQGSYQTAIGEQEIIDLPDGSQITLNTNTAFEVNFTKMARVITLSKGEAYFDVAPDKTKPFSVKTSSGVVTAVGTAFSVRMLEDKIDVLVTEGRVSLEAIPQLELPTDIPNVKRPLLEVSAGQSVLFSQHAEIIDIVVPALIEQKNDWQDGELSFRGVSLGQVIAEISRYSETEIEIADDALREQKVHIYYEIGDLETMFEALNLMANVQVERIDEHHVKLYREQ